MRTLTFSAAAAGNVVLFPNGCRFDDNDVFVGSGFIETIKVTHSNLAAFTAVAAVYDTVVVATNRILVGGTTTTDAYRVIAANVAANNGPQGDPISAAAPNAQLSACRQVGSYNISIAASQPETTIIVNQMCRAGMAVHVNVLGIDLYTIEVNFVPHTSGGTRRRNAGYLPPTHPRVVGGFTTSTTKVVPAQGTVQVL